MAEGQQLPGTYGVKDWIESIKGQRITAYIDRELMPEVKEGKPFTKDDFIKDLSKASRRIKK
ncbi:MAG: hypothetical protein ABR954_00640 [Dehalococcoidales bacterium]